MPDNFSGLDLTALTRAIPNRFSLSMSSREAAGSEPAAGAPLDGAPAAGPHAVVVVCEVERKATADDESVVTSTCDFAKSALFMAHSLKEWEVADTIRRSGTTSPCWPDQTRYRGFRASVALPANSESIDARRANQSHAAAPQPLQRTNCTFSVAEGRSRMI